MTSHNQESKLIIWILLPVLLALLAAAWVGLQLFQDGSSYLLEMLIDHSAVRNGRMSILFFQFPTIFLIKVFHWMELNTLTTLPIIRLAFNINYALTPFVSLFLSWLVVRKKRPELFLWAALIILFVNLVNFSWVSELLIAVQFCCPLLLALLQDPGSKTFRILLAFLIPFIFFLHPLVIALYLVMAAAAAYIAYCRPVYRSAAKLGMILFLSAAAARAAYSFFTLSPYEMGFASPGEVSNYFVISRVENILFLATACQLACLILLSRSILRSRKWVVKAMFWFVALEASLLSFLAVRILFHSNISLVVFIGILGISAFIDLRYSRKSAPAVKLQLLYISYTFLAIAAGSLLMAQYGLSERLFTLKMGLDLLVNLLIMSIATIDSLRDPMPDEYPLRFRLVIAFSTIFVCVMVVKSVMWQTAVQKLEQIIRQTEVSCTELTGTDFRWLEKTPYTMINNWSLPSLALVIQDEQPRKVLLAQNDCQPFYQSGMIQVDPWSRFSKDAVVPPLE